MLWIKPSKKSLLCLAGCAVLLLLLCCFTYYNLASRLRALDVQIVQKADKLENSEEIARRLSVVEQRYLTAQSELSVLEQGVSTRAYVPTLLRQIEDLGKSVSLRVVGVRPKPLEDRPAPPKSEAEGKQKTAKKPEPYDKLEIDMDVNGKYYDVMRFLYKITSFPKIIAVNTVQITPAAQPGEIASPTLSVRLGTTAFILKESAGQADRSTERRAEAGGRRT